MEYIQGEREILELSFHSEREEREIRRRDGKRERELSFHSERKKKEKRERERRK